MYPHSASANLGEWWRSAENVNAERERNFAKCWESGGKYFAKFASRLPDFLAGWAEIKIQKF
jgi:hypothetical protein